MTTTDAIKAIRREIESNAKLLKPTDSKRWRHGYVDGLKKALSIVEGKGGKG